MNAPRASSQRQHTKLSIGVIPVPVSRSRFPLGIWSPSRQHRTRRRDLARGAHSIYCPEYLRAEEQRSQIHVGAIDLNRPLGGSGEPPLPAAVFSATL